jgi:hypothetical protein
VRNYGRPSLAIGADDLGVLREGNESDEDILRRQLIDKDRENDRVRVRVIFTSGYVDASYSSEPKSKLSRLS